MEWRRFHYICRRSHHQHTPGESLRDCIERVDAETASHLYGATEATDTLPYRLLQELKQAPNTHLAQIALKTYGDMDFSDSLTEPLQFKRVMLYLGYVTFVFFVTSCLYQFKVAPAFLGVVESMSASTPSALLAYQGYWIFLSVLVFALLLAVLVIGYRLRALFSYQPRVQQSLSFRFFTLPQTRRAYSRILEAAAFPLSACSDYQPTAPSEMTSHLEGIDASGMDVGREVQELIRQTGMQLTASCEKQMRILSVIVSVIIVAVIFRFVASVYAPIFYLGETI